MELTSEELIEQDNVSASLESETTEAGEALDTFWLTIAGILPLLGLLPMMFIEATHIWSLAHYRFAVLTSIAAVLVIGLQFRPAKPSKVRFKIAVASTSIGTLVGIVSIWFFLPQLAHLAFSICLFGWLLGSWERLVGRESQRLSD